MEVTTLILTAMLIFHRLLFCLSLSGLLAALSGCDTFSSDGGGRPSILNAPPPPRPEKHERGGGVAVLVGLPGQPTAARAVADLGAYAQARGFVQQAIDGAQPPAAGSSDPSPKHYLLGEIKLDVVYQAADLRATAFLHGLGSRMNRRFVDEFYQGFCQEYAPRYGAEASIIENDYTEDAGIPAAGTNRGGTGRGR